MGSKLSAVLWRYADIQYGFLDRELGYDDLHALAAEGRHKAVRKHLKHGMNPNARRLEGAFGADDDERGDTPMICTARGVLGNKDQKRHVKTLEVLLHFGAKVNEPNLLHQTPLYIACERNAMRIAMWLLQHDADVNINCKTGVSPLMCAYQNQNTTLGTMLLEKGAIVIRPPASFNCIKFPELANELGEDEASSSDKGAVMLHSTVQQYVDREAERRETLLKAAQEEQRLEDQRIYREQLGREGEKHKDRRRRKRLEAQQRRNLPPVQVLDSETERDEDHSSHINVPANQGDGLLLWEKKTMVSRPRSVVSERPRWVARQIHCTQQSQGESEHDFMNQCSKLHDALEQDRSRRRSVRAIVTAPANGSRRELPSQVRPETASF